MSATDDLRRLLDERGVEWTANDGEYVKETCWPYMGELTAAFAEYYDGTTRFACDTWCFTPEQAIAATLGRGTCDQDWVRDLVERHSDCLGGNARAFHNGAYARIAEEIAATLGRGTCHAVFEVDAMSEDERVGEFVCSECGETFGDGHGEFPRYCPNCGARVVEP